MEPKQVLRSDHNNARSTPNAIPISLMSVPVHTNGMQTGRSAAGGFAIDDNYDHDAIDDDDDHDAIDSNNYHDAFDKDDYTMMILTKIMTLMPLTTMMMCPFDSFSFVGFCFASLASLVGSLASFISLD